MLPKFLQNLEIFQDGKFLQILVLSFSFMLVFTAFQTTSFIQQTVLASVQLEDPNFTGSGYVSLCIIYAVFAVGSWLAPSFVAVFQSKWSMVISAAVYVLFIVQFTFPTTWVLYVTSFLLGAAASLLWCAQGNFLTLASDSQTISRNSGVFWAINQCSLFFGNLFVFFQFHGKKVIDSKTRLFVYTVLTIVASCGVACLIFLKNLKEGDSSTSSDSEQNPSEIGLPVQDKATADSAEKESSSPKGGKKQKSNGSEAKSNFQVGLDALVQAIKLFFTPYMLLLSVASFYTGWCQCFFFSVYSTSVGNTLQFDDPKRLVGLIGIFTGIGEVLGGTVFGLLGSKTTKKGRSPVVLLGLLIHAMCYTLIFLNLPNESPIKETEEISVIEHPVAWLALMCALLLGFGDACYQTQLFAIFGSVYSDKSAAAFAIFKFTQSVSSAIAFFSSSYMGILSQMLTLLISAILGFASIFLTEFDTKRKSREIKIDGQSSSSVSEVVAGDSETVSGIRKSDVPENIS